MKGLRYIISLLVAFQCLTLRGQDSICAKIQFPIYAGSLDADAMSILDKFTQRLDSVILNDEITRVRIKGMSSPDGPHNLNVRLAGDRANALYMYIFPSRGFALDSIDMQVVGEDWIGFRKLALADKMMPSAGNVLEIIDSDLPAATKKYRLKRLNGGRVWEYLSEHTFPKLRAASVEVNFMKNLPIMETVEFDLNSDSKTDLTESDQTGESDDDLKKNENIEDSPAVTDLSDKWAEQMSIKSNLPVWLAAMPNIAIEFDLGHHFSIAASVYYSGWDYFKRNIKFRNLTVMPELRYWPRSDNMGFFLGIHGGMAWYNVAWGGDRRYQDHDGKTPALGGGVNIGYKFPLRSKHWSMEVSVGAGAYKLDYDVFMNEPNGILIDRKKKMFYGVDNAALSICYHFGLKKKGGRK